MIADITILSYISAVFLLLKSIFCSSSKLVIWSNTLDLRPFNTRGNKDFPCLVIHSNLSLLILNNSIPIMIIKQKAHNIPHKLTD